MERWIYQRGVFRRLEGLLFMLFLTGAAAMFLLLLMKGAQLLPEGLAFARERDWIPALIATPIALILIPFFLFVLYTFIKIWFDVALDTFSSKRHTIEGTIEKKEMRRGYRTTLFESIVQGERFALPSIAYAALKEGQHIKITTTARIRKVVSILAL